MRKKYPDIESIKKLVSKHCIVFDRYFIEMPLREDATVLEYLAYDQEKERNIAFRILPDEQFNKRQIVKKITGQIEQASAIEHENIARLYSFEKWKHFMFITSEYVGHVTLAKYLKEEGGRLPFEKVIELLRQVANALDFAHARSPSLIHGDIRPQTIMIQKNGIVKIADFGVSNVVSNLSLFHSPKGVRESVLPYKAPEQLDEKRVISPDVDIYALSAIAYEIIAGRNHFDAKRSDKPVYGEDIQKIVGIPDAANKALCAGLSRNTRKRPIKAIDFMAMLASEPMLLSLEKDADEPFEEDGLEELGGSFVREEEKPEESEELEERKEMNEPSLYDEGERREVIEERVKKPFFVYILLSILLICVVGFGLYFVKTMLEKRTPTHEVKTKKITKPLVGDLNVASTPSGADVYLNNQRRGKTPLKLVDLEKGVYKLTVKKEGYQDTYQEVNILPLMLMNVSVKLKEAFGTIHIESEPPEAVVFIDGEKSGKTPFEVKEIKEGRYRIVVKKKGYTDWEKEVDIKSKDDLKLLAGLKFKFGTLIVKSSPPKADVYIADEKRGKTPLTIERLKAGKQKIVVKKSGYGSWTKSVDIKAGDMTKLNADLNEVFGGLKITSTPDGADVYLDGKKKGKTPVLFERQEIGSLKVEVKKECFDTGTRTVRIHEKGISEFDFKLKPLCGSISITSSPVAALWYIDGEYGGITPGKMENIKVGSHEIKILLQDYMEWTETIDVQGGITEDVKAELQSVLPQMGEESKDLVTRMEFVWIEKGCFMMGAWADELGRDSDEIPLHEACFEKGFWIGKYEVTQGQWTMIMGSNPSFFTKGDDYPVENVSWNDIHLFIDKINRLNEDEGTVYRLPTEAEWEYACKGGDTRDPLSEETFGAGYFSWFDRNSKRTTHPSGWKVPNEFHLYDMTGNVYEWVTDTYHEDAYQKHQKLNPVITEDSEVRTIRGGSWYHSEKDCRCANRNYYKKDSGNYYTGFRLVKEEMMQ